MPLRRPNAHHRPDPTRSTPLQRHLYRIIFETDTVGGKIFDVVMFISIMISVTVVCLQTVESLAANYSHLFVVLEWFFTLLFTAEFALRLFAVRHRFRYLTSFYGIVDLLSILPSYIEVLLLGQGTFTILRAFQLLRVCRVLKLLHLSSEAGGIAKAIWNTRNRILAFLVFVSIAVTISGTLMYEIEHTLDPNSEFTSIPQAIYWAVFTMTMVGYGDIVPQTTLGRFISAGLIMVGYSMIIVPTGFVAAEIIQAHQRLRSPKRSCSKCSLEGHDSDANYCRICGGILKTVNSSNQNGNDS